MIPRYTRPEMASIWEPQTRFKIWFEIEAHAADAQAELGVIPKEAARTIWAKGKDATFNVARIDEIERETHHDVIAFLTHLAEIVGPEARFVHQGMTSSDVLDTCLNVQLSRAADILIADLDDSSLRASLIDLLSDELNVDIHEMSHRARCHFERIEGFQSPATLNHYVKNGYSPAQADALFRLVKEFLAVSAAWQSMRRPYRLRLPARR